MRAWEDTGFQRGGGAHLSNLGGFVGFPLLNNSFFYHHVGSDTKIRLDPLHCLKLSFFPTGNRGTRWPIFFTFEEQRWHQVFRPIVLLLAKILLNNSRSLVLLPAKLFSTGTVQFVTFYHDCDSADYNIFVCFCFG